MEETLFTLAETAAVLRVSVNTMRHWRKNGLGPSGFKVGRHVVYTQAELNRWVAEQQSTRS